MKKSNGKEAESIIFILVFSIFLSLKSFLETLELRVFPFSFSKVLSFSAIILTFEEKRLLDLYLFYLSAQFEFSKSYFFFTFLLSFISLSSRPLSDPPLLFIVLPNGLKKHSREKGVIRDVTLE